MEDRCVVCDEIVPEGTLVCPMCAERGRSFMNDDKFCRENPVIKKINIIIDTIDKVKDFCNLCSKCTGDVLVYSGRYTVSGKSIMGLFSLNLGKPVKVEIYGNISSEVEEGIKKFIVD